MFCAVHLDKIAGGDFFEVLRSLVVNYIPDGGTIVKLLSELSILFLILGVMVGISQCFFGYQLRRLWTAILMIVLCGCSGAALATELKLPVAALVGVTAAMAVVGGLLGYFLWIVGCFFRPFAVVSISVFAAFVINDMQTLGLIIALAAGLIAGIVSAAFYRVCLILYTSVFGGLLTGACIAELTGLDLWYLPLVIGGILALAGLIVQLLVNRRTKETERTENTPEGDGTERKQSGEFSGTDEPAVQGVLEAEAARAPETDTLENTARPEDGAAAEAYVQDDGALELAAAAESENDKGTGLPEGLKNTASDAETENTAADRPCDTAGTARDVCPACGTPHGAGAKFCMQCGRRLIG